MRNDDIITSALAIHDVHKDQWLQYSGLGNRKQKGHKNDSFDDVIVSEECTVQMESHCQFINFMFIMYDTVSK